MYRAKILVLGPCKAGKTTIANFLSESTEMSGGEYHATQGCRILEFEQSGIQVNNRNINAEVELWDVSGDHKFESCWPAIARDTNGVVFVFNPDQSNHDKDLESWWSYFVENQGIRDAQCVAFAHYKTGTEYPVIEQPSNMGRVNCVKTNIDDDGDMCREEFQNFLSNLLNLMSERREQEELSIIR